MTFGDGCWILLMVTQCGNPIDLLLTLAIMLIGLSWMTSGIGGFL